MAQGVPVRGKCKAGHALTTTAPPGRVTWRGTCPAEGCELELIARRIPPKDRDATPPPAAAEPGKKDRKPYKVIKGYRDDDTDTEPSFGTDDDDRRGRPAGGSPRVRPAPDTEGTGSAGSGDDDDPPTQRRGILRRRRQGSPPVDGDFRVIEGIY